jgi:fimbrial chaperone protein
MSCLRRRLIRKRRGWHVGQIAVCLLLAATLAPLASAATIRLSSIRLILSPQTPITPLTVHNDGAEPALLQVQIVEWTERDAVDVYAPTRDVLGNPLQFTLPPNGDQIIRFGLRVGPAPVERAYRVFIQEVPSNIQVVTGQVRTLLKLSVPLFVQPVDAAGDGPTSKAAAGTLDWKVSVRKSGNVMIRLTNNGRFHIQIADLTLSAEGGASLLDEHIAGYLLPGQTKGWEFSRSHAVAGQTVHLSAKTDLQAAPLEALLRVGDSP